MPPTQIYFGMILIGLLVATAGFFIVRQLRALKHAAQQSKEEAGYLRSQIKRRLSASVLMMILAGLLGGALLFLEAPAQKLADQGPVKQLSPDQKQFVNLYSYYWIFFLLLLFGLLVLAALDFRATRQYARQQYQRIRDERRALIEQEAAHLRNQRQ